MWHVFRHLASPGAVPEQRQWRPKPCARLAALGNRLHVTLEKAGGKELVVVAHDTVPNEAKSAPVADGCLDSNIAVFGTAGGSRQCDGFHSSSRSMPPDNVVLGGHRRVRILSADAGHAAREASAALSGTQRPSPNKVACVGLQSGSISTPSKRRFQVATTITIYDLIALACKEECAHTLWQLGACSPRPRVLSAGGRRASARRSLQSRHERASVIIMEPPGICVLRAGARAADTQRSAG